MSGYYPAGCTTKEFDSYWEGQDVETVIYTCNKCGHEYEGELEVDWHHNGEEVELEEPCDMPTPNGECGGTYEGVFYWEGNRGE